MLKALSNRLGRGLASTRHMQDWRPEASSVRPGEAPQSLIQPLLQGQQYAPNGHSHDSGMSHTEQLQTQDLPQARVHPSSAGAQPGQYSNIPLSAHYQQAAGSYDRSAGLPDQDPTQRESAAHEGRQAISRLDSPDSFLDQHAQDRASSTMSHGADAISHDVIRDPTQAHTTAQTPKVNNTPRAASAASPSITPGGKPIMAGVNATYIVHMQAFNLACIAVAAFNSLLGGAAFAGLLTHSLSLALAAPLQQQMQQSGSNPSCLGCEAAILTHFITLSFTLLSCTTILAAAVLRRTSPRMASVALWFAGVASVGAFCATVTALSFMAIAQLGCTALGWVAFGLVIGLGGAVPLILGGILMICHMAAKARMHRRAKLHSRGIKNQPNTALTTQAKGVKAQLAYLAGTGTKSHIRHTDSDSQVVATRNSEPQLA